MRRKKFAEEVPPEVEAEPEEAIPPAKDDEHDGQLDVIA